MKPGKPTAEYSNLLERIGSRYEQGRSTIASYVNTEIVATYWHIGQYIVEFEQGGNAKAGYGESLLENLSKDLSLSYGKGFSLSNLKRMRQFFLVYPNGATVSHHLGWSMYVELLKMEDPIERSFYQQQSILEKWNVRELIRQKRSSLFLRLAASKDKDASFNYPNKGKLLKNPWI